jgi:hypothetical protein
MLVGLRITHHGTVAIVDLSFFAWRGEDEGTRFRGLGTAQPPHVPLEAFTGAREAVLVHQILPDRPGIASAPWDLSGLYE